VPSAAPPYGPYGQPPVPPQVPPPHPTGYLAPRPATTTLPAPVRIDPVPGTIFGIAYLGVPPLVAGQAIASLVVGIGSILVATVVGCFGLFGAKGGWGPLVGGAFAVLAFLLGLAGLGLGLFGLRRIRQSGGQITGRGLAIAGISCGLVGVGLTAISLLMAVVLVQTS
jgi:hypothetical protein